MGVAILIVTAVALVMALLGWRVTYAPELDNSWNAISAVAEWAGVIVAFSSVVASFLAIWYAIRVPQKIAEQQNKIELFEKRYEIYMSISKMMQVTEQIWKVGDTVISNTLKFFDSFCSSPKNFSMNLNVRNIAEERRKIIDVVLSDTEKIKMLFKDIPKQNIEIIQKVLIFVMTVVVNSCSVARLKDQITKKDWENIQNTLDKMEQQLHIN